MLPPHEPTRRKKVTRAKSRKSAGPPARAMAKAGAAAASRGAIEPARPALRVLGREVAPSPIVAARKRRIGC